MAKKIIKLTESDLHRLIKESIKIVLREEYDNEKVDGYVHYYDAKGRQYRLDYLAQELRNMGIDVEGTGFNDEDEYDGYVEVKVNLEQAKILHKKYGSKFNMIGKGNSVEEEFTDALRIEKMVNGWGY